MLSRCSWPLRRCASTTNSCILERRASFFFFTFQSPHWVAVSFLLAIRLNAFFFLPLLLNQLIYIPLYYFTHSLHFIIKSDVVCWAVSDWGVRLNLSLFVVATVATKDAAAAVAAVLNAANMSTKNVRSKQKTALTLIDERLYEASGAAWEFFWIFSAPLTLVLAHIFIIENMLSFSYFSCFFFGWRWNEAFVLSNFLHFSYI